MVVMPPHLKLFLRPCLQYLSYVFYHVTQILTPPHSYHPHQTIGDGTRSGHHLRWLVTYNTIM